MCRDCLSTEHRHSVGKYSLVVFVNVMCVYFLGIVEQFNTMHEGTYTEDWTQDWTPVSVSILLCFVCVVIHVYCSTSLGV